MDNNVSPITTVGDKGPKKLSFKHKSTHLFTFVGIFVIAGVYFVFNSFAATPIVATLQAEAMTLPNGATVISDSKASGGKAVQMPDNGSMTGSINIPANDTATSVTVSAHEANCSTSSSADLTASVDGTKVINATPITGTAWNNYSGNVQLNSGSHTVTITGSNLSTAATNDNTGHGRTHNKGHHHNGFFNRHNGSGNSGGGSTTTASTCNLYVDVTNIYGPTPASAPSVAFSASPTTVTSGSKSTLTWSSTNATSCTASGAWSGTQATSGSFTTTALTTASQYNLSCSGAGGTTTAKIAVSVTTTTGGGTGTGGIGIGTGTNGSGTGTGGTGTGTNGSGTAGSGIYTKPPTKQANRTPNQWYWEISPSGSGLSGLPSTSGAYPAAGSANIWDTDMFQDSNVANGGMPTGLSPVVQAIHAVGHYSICYVEVGAYQTGFPDNANFALADYGGQTSAHAMKGWAGEWWFDTSGFANYVAGQPNTLTGAAVNIASGMDKRVAGCKTEGQDALEPDDLDGFTNPSTSGAAGGGWGLTQADAAGYERWLAYDAHSHGLAIFQKNDTDNAKADASMYDGMIIEECNKYADPCSADASPYTSLGKPVLNAEYTNDGETTAKFCSTDESLGITGALYDLNLDGKSYSPCQN